MLFLTRSYSIALVAMTLVVASTGCSKNSSNTASQAPHKIAAASAAAAARLVAEGHTNEAAAEYARIGELLLVPEGIQYADKMFDRALELDPNNGKANFYGAVTKPLMRMQGFISRFAQVAEPDDQKKLASLRKEIEKLNLPELTKFAVRLPDGKSPFADYHEVQRFLKTELLPEVVKSVEKLSRLMGRNDLELNINLARLGFRKMKSTSDYRCEHSVYTYTETSGGGYDAHGNPIAKLYQFDNWYCSYTSTMELKDILKAERVVLDASDLKIVRGSMMALADFLRLSSAYSFAGLQEAINNLKILEKNRDEHYRHLSTRDVIQELQRHPDLFTIEKDQEIVALAHSQEQVLRDALSLGELQADLCQNAERAQGENLIKSFCLYANDLNTIQTALDLLAGPRPIKIGFDGEGAEV
ncbi:MAG: hypothetical protein HY074_01605, partial [Deltaproteobacteria bacterium]|nr:hypothetical protein [Deltaproteobacteria bacterium]